MDGGLEPNHWWGVLGAVICGLGYRLGPEILAAAGLAGAVIVAGACFIMVIDAFSG